MIRKDAVMNTHSRIKAVYRDGTFVPRTPLRLPDESEVELSIEAIDTKPVDELERQARLELLIARMRSQPIEGNPPKLTRDELHERG